MVFFRRRRPGRHAEDGDVFSELPADEPVDDEEALEEHISALSKDEEDAREGGPYDIDEIPEGDQTERLDLGSLKIPNIDGVEIRIQGIQDDNVDAVVLVAGDSALQISALAAPRSENIWDEVRDDLRKTILAEGGTAEEVKGPYGSELRGRVRTPNGPADVRLVGFDGPRWLVKCLFQGRAAADPEAGAALHQCLELLVVDRGKEARPVGEPLPLTLPREIADHIAAQASQAQEAAPQDQPAPNGSAAGRKGARPRRR